MSSVSFVGCAEGAGDLGNVRRVLSEIWGSVCCSGGIVLGKVHLFDKSMKSMWFLKEYM